MQGFWETVKKLVVQVFGLGLIVAVGWLIVREASVGQIVGFVVFVTVIIVIGVLAAKYEKIDKAIKTAFANYMVFTFVTLVIAGVVWLFRWISEWIMESLSGTLQVIALVVWGVVLAIPLLGLSTQAWRKKLFKAFSPIGWVAPLAGSFLILMVSVLFFADVTYLLVDLKKLDRTGGEELTYAALQDLYLWHFLDAVPSLKVNDTLKWGRPVTYQGGGVGWLLLLFKIAVILPIIGTFLGYRKFRREQREERD